MNIIITEQNKVFRESLRTALNQISDFNIILDSDTESYPESIYKKDVHLIIIDSYYLGKNNRINTIINARNIWNSVKILVMINYKEECYNCFDNNIDHIFKNSSKKEFENKIRELLITEKVTF